MQEAAATAPWVEFKVVAEEDRNASIESGTYTARDVDYAFITPAGSKDCVEKPVDAWFTDLQVQVENNRFPQEWFRHFKGMYKDWKENAETPVEGTSVKNWAVASPAQIETLLKIHVRTVEQLASANEEVISRLGMGGRAMVEKAKAYVSQSTSGVGKLAEENVGLKMKLDAAQGVQAKQADELAEMKAQIAALMKGQDKDAPAPAPAPEPSADIGDLLDSDQPRVNRSHKL